MGGKPKPNADETKLARKLVQDYLKDCGGTNSGFLYGTEEQRLARSIAKALRDRGQS